VLDPFLVVRLNEKEKDIIEKGLIIGIKVEAP